MSSRAWPSWARTTSGATTDRKYRSSPTTRSNGVVDRYHYAHGGAARAGLRDRAAQTAGRVRRARPDAVLHLVNDHDEAAGWELPALRDLLGAGTPVLRVRLPDGDDRAPLLEAAARLLQEVHVG